MFWASCIRDKVCAHVDRSPVWNRDYFVLLLLLSYKVYFLTKTSWKEFIPTGLKTSVDVQVFRVRVQPIRHASAPTVLHPLLPLSSFLWVQVRHSRPSNPCPKKFTKHREVRC